MRRRGRVRRVAAGLGAFAALWAVALIISVWWSIIWVTSSESAVGVSAGLFVFISYIPEEAGLFVERQRETRFEFAPTIALEQPVRLVFLPMWMLVAAFALMSVVFWRKGRVPPGHCQRCGYDLMGNVSGRCSECGERV